MTELEQFEIGSPCTIKIDDEKYPAIYLEYNNLWHVVYLKHLDSTVRVKNVYAYEPIDIKEDGSRIQYKYMEAPAYFRKGTKLGIKWGNSAYLINGGGCIDVKPDETVDKITCTIVG
jgi:hypothetical protein